MDERGFDAVVGHKDIIEHLQNSADSGKISHAYLFTGEPGSGKKLLATLFATLLECEKGRSNPCMKCPSCRKALSQNHPDIIMVTHEKPNTISVQEIRDQVVNTVDIKPYESRYKIYIIDEAEKMNPQAQNALLKTIEEPPAYAVIMLLANSPDALLATILSRCIRLNLKAVSDRKVREYLMREMHLPDYEAEVAAAFAQGNIGRAQEAAAGDAFADMTGKTVEIVKGIHDMRIYEIVDTVKSLSEDKSRIDDFLDVLLMWFRDVLIYKATRETDGLVFRRELAEIRRQASVSSYEGLEEILDAIETAKVRLRANVNFDLTLELLFLTIAENL
ncbi:MAG: DNA polymerase III subunit delta' [Lachnospiraceae bacterium]|nr:DNA polymerase III subunit delta' [Lachnospiraceae bacterium]